MDPYGRATALALAGDAKGAATLLWNSPASLANAGVHSYALLLANHVIDDPEYVYKKHLEWARIHTSAFPSPMDFANPRDPEKKLRIGYISANLTEGHPTTYF